MARLRNRGAEVGLREYLLEQAVDIRDLYGLVVDGAWEELSKPVDQLLGVRRTGYIGGSYRTTIPQ